MGVTEDFPGGVIRMATPGSEVAASDWFHFLAASRAAISLRTPSHCWYWVRAV